jgi:hypothetical protein
MTSVKTAERRAKRLVRWQAGRALSQGILKRMSCIRCGEPDAQMHHADYSKPYQVTWLCFQCHHGHHVSDMILGKRASPGPKLPSDEMLSALIRFGFRYRDIADRFDVNENQVSRRAKRLGFPPIAPGTHQAKMRPVSRRHLGQYQHI